MEENQSEKIVIRVEHDKRIFVYDFNKLETLQSEYAKAVGEYKHYQSQADPSNMNDIFRSRSPEWLNIICSYLFKEEINGVLQDFNRVKTETDFEKFFAKYPTYKRSDLEAVVKDFFTNMGESGIASSLLSSVSNKIKMQMLQRLLTAQKPQEEKVKSSLNGNKK